MFKGTPNPKKLRPASVKINIAVDIKNKPHQDGLAKLFFFSDNPGKKGIIAKINVKVGDVLDAGETACIIEAMKMQNEIKMPVKGKITKLPVKETATVDKGETVINYNPVE